MYPPNFQLGITWLNNQGIKCITGCSLSETGKRRAKLIESSYVGTLAMGAMHYYAKIQVPKPS